MKWPREIKALGGGEPHKEYGGWKNFLKTCEVRDEHEGVVFLGRTNCNYILFPDGTLVQNFGYHGRGLMSRIREQGADVVRDQLVADRRELDRLLEKHGLDGAKK